MKIPFLIVFIFLSSLSIGQCIQGDCINGYGILTCDCGYTFEGEFKEGMKFYGTLTKEDLVYTGSFKNDVAHGYGLIRYADGSWYEGDFALNQPHGYGKFKYSQGQTYIGQFKEGSFNGLGALIIDSSDSMLTEYEIGQFENDLLSGIGFSLYLNGNMFFGSHDGGDKNGYGIFLIPASQDAEVGFFKPSRVIKNVALLGYPHEGSVKATKLTYKGVSYESSALLTGEQMSIHMEVDEIKTVYYFDTKQQLFFISDGNNSAGLAINTNGEIYKSEIILNENPRIVLNKLLHAWQHDSDL